MSWSPCRWSEQDCHDYLEHTAMRHMQMYSSGVRRPALPALRDADRLLLSVECVNDADSKAHLPPHTAPRCPVLRLPGRHATLMMTHVPVMTQSAEPLGRCYAESHSNCYPSPLPPRAVLLPLPLLSFSLNSIDVAGR